MLKDLVNVVKNDIKTLNNKLTTKRLVAGVSVLVLLNAGMFTTMYLLNTYMFKLGQW